MDRVDNLTSEQAILPLTTVQEMVLSGEVIAYAIIIIRNDGEVCATATMSHLVDAEMLEGSLVAGCQLIRDNKREGI